VLKNFKVITLNGVAKRRGASGGTRFGAHQQTLFRYQTFENAFFSRNLSQNMYKNAYFLEKSCKIAAASGAAVGLWRLYTPPSDPRVGSSTY